MKKLNAILPFIERLKRMTALSDNDAELVQQLPIEYKAFRGDPIVVTGQRPSVCSLIIDGFVLRSKQTADGRRQILSIHQPGDIPDLQSLYLHVMDHDVMPAGEAMLGLIPHDDLRELVRKAPTVAEVLWRDTLVDAAIFREWILNVGQRDAAGRLAHLFLELFYRARLIGRAKDMSFRLPLTQVDLADAAGVTSIHVNRMLQDLRSQGLVELRKGNVTICDEAKLRALAGFDSLYLHMDPAL